MSKLKVLKDIRTAIIEPGEEFKSFGIERCNGGWSLATIIYGQDDKIIRIERSEPNIKAIAINQLKIEISKNFLNALKDVYLKVNNG